MKSMTKTLVGFAAAGAMSVFGSSALAGPVDLIVEGGGAPQVFQLDNGNRLGLWGFDNRGNESAITFNESELMSGFVSGSPLGFLDADFDPFTFPATVEADTRNFDAIWVEWAGGNLVYNFEGNTRTMGDGVTLEGDPTAVPTPAMAGLLGLGLLGIAAMRRRRD